MLIVYRLLASLCASAWFRRKYTVVIFMLLNISKPVISLSVRVFLRNIVRVYWGIQILKGNLCSLSNSNFIHHRTFTADYSPSLWVHRFCKTKVANMRRSKKGLSYLALWCFGIQSNPNPIAIRSWCLLACYRFIDVPHNLTVCRCSRWWPSKKWPRHQPKLQEHVSLASLRTGAWPTTVVLNTIGQNIEQTKYMTFWYFLMWFFGDSPIS